MSKVKKLLVAGLTVSCLGLTACQQTWSHEDIGTATGAVSGAVLGGVLFQGDSKIPAILGGALLGGFLGNRIGNKMDANDQAALQRAIVLNPINQPTSW